jgi:hypothetical protein
MIWKTLVSNNWKNKSGGRVHLKVNSNLLLRKIQPLTQVLLKNRCWKEQQLMKCRQKSLISVCLSSTKFKRMKWRVRHNTLMEKCSECSSQVAEKSYSQTESPSALILMATSLFCSLMAILNRHSLMAELSISSLKLRRLRQLSLKAFRFSNFQMDSWRNTMGMD